MANSRVPNPSSGEANDGGRGELQRMTPQLQALMMILANVLVTFVVFLTLFLGYSKTRWPPKIFLFCEIVVVFGNAFAAWTELFCGNLAAKLGRYEYAPSPKMARWIRHRVTEEPFLGKGFLSRRTLLNFASLRGVTWFSAGLGFVAIWDVIAKTGGGIESPYAPLLVAPALLGPFVVMDPRALFVLLLAAIGWVAYADATGAHHSSKLSTSRLDHPHYLVYAGVTLVLVGSALLISYLTQRGPRLTSAAADAAMTDAGPETTN